MTDYSWLVHTDPGNS